MEKSPNKIKVEEIQQIFIAKPKTEENGSVSNQFAPTLSRIKKDTISKKKKKKKNNKKKKVNPTENI